MYTKDANNLLKIQQMFVLFVYRPLKKIIVKIFGSLYENWDASRSNIY